MQTNSTSTSPYFKAKDLKIPPHNIEAEKSLLGSVIMSPEVMHDVVDIVKDHSFYSNQNRAVWIILFELHSKNIPIDLLSVSSRLKENIGGNTVKPKVFKMKIGNVFLFFLYQRNCFFYRIKPVHFVMVQFRKLIAESGYF